MASVRKRTWTSPNGEAKLGWGVRYTDPATGKTPGKTFRLKKEADAYARKVEREIEDGVHITRSSSRTVTETIMEFCADVDRRAAEGQVGTGYARSTRRALDYAIPVIGPLVVADLKWQDVEEYGRVLRRVTSKQHGRRLSNATIRVYLNTLQSAIAYGVRRGYAARNVVPDAVKELGAMPSKAIETFTTAEMRQLVATIETKALHQTYRGQAFLRVATYLGAMCGLRRGEILALTWDAIDFDRMQIHVRSNLTPEDVIKGPKTVAGRRTVPMPRMVAAALKAWEPYVAPEPRGLIFRSRTGGAWQDATFYRDAWHPLLNRAGIVSDREYGHRHFHALRHFAGSAWLEAGVSLPEVSRLLGHANMAITARIYSHAVAEVHHRAATLDNCAGLLAAPSDTQELRKAA